MNYRISNCGYYGKLPIRGDFIQRNLTEEFVTLWDNWLQNVINASQQSLGDQWLDNYLISPIWRFFIYLDSGNQYAGIMLPSVDKVGRYFPYTIVSTVPRDEKLLNFLSANKTWFEQAEELAIRALDEQLDFDELNQAIDNLAIIDPGDSLPGIKQNSRAYLLELSEEQSLDAAISRVQARLSSPANQMTSYWWKDLIEDEPGKLLSCLGLPDENVYVAMLDGQWDLCHVNRLDEAE